MFRFRSPVKREGAERYLLISVISFAAAVVLVRLYLEATGYPSIGNGVLHIAHVLWGGLLLFIAALLSLIIANRWVYRLSAILTGVGVGLFIDEVGKFITRSNDYFFPFAAPIIYAFFLLTVMIYLEVRRPSKQDSRTELYHALDQIMELIENDLDAQERSDLEARLRRVVAEPEYPEHARLAEALLAVLNSDTLTVVNPPRIQRVIDKLLRWEAKIFDERRYRLIVVIGLAVVGISLLVELAVYASALLSHDLLNVLVASVLDKTLVNGPTSASWFIILLVLIAISGSMITLGSLVLFLGSEQLGSELGYLGLLIALTMVTLLLFYFNQFAAISTTILEFAVLIALLRYRRLYLGVGSQITLLNQLRDKSPGKITVAVEARDE